MTPKEIISKVTNNLEGVVPKNSWGETSLFYNPCKKLPNGVYFCTIKENDGENDTSSNLSRDAVFRLSIGISKETYINNFGENPIRPQKGSNVETGHDFAKINVLMPHPVYAWMSWACILSPTKEKFQVIYPLIVEAHANAISKYNKKLK